MEPEPEPVVHPPTVKQAGDPRGQQATWTMMPVDTSNGECSQCAVVHDPEDPHDKQSLAYQYTFYAEHGRWPTWTDAMAHCSTEKRLAWAMALSERGVDLD